MFLLIATQKYGALRWNRLYNSSNTWLFVSWNKLPAKWNVTPYWGTPFLYKKTFCIISGMGYKGIL